MISTRTQSTMSDDLNPHPVHISTRTQSTMHPVHVISTRTQST